MGKDEEENKKINFLLLGKQVTPPPTKMFVRLVVVVCEMKLVRFVF